MLSVPSSDVGHAKKVLSKCANALIGNQELGGQQVASYLLGNKDFYSSHHFHSLYWTSSLACVNKADPLQQPLCLQSDDQSQLQKYESGHPSSGSGVTTDSLQQAEDVFLEKDPQGGFNEKGSQVMDYICCDDSDTFGSMCVWDFVASVEKELLSAGSKNFFIDTSSSFDGLQSSDNDDFEDDNYLHITKKRGLWAKNQQSPLHSSHPQSKIHMLRLWNVASQVVPVPIGPGLPHRDNAAKYDYYCQVMLTLFKPW